MTKHTPGEWAVWADGDIVGGAPQEEPVVVCNVLAGSARAANARLIAAAPEILRELKDCLHILEGNDLDTRHSLLPHLDPMRAAIRKAEGE